MFWKKENRESSEINWNHLNTIEQLEQIKEESRSQPVLIYKHSTRCSISSMALDRLERSWSKELDTVKAYYLDLITYREISNAIAKEFGIYHESPQAILIKDGKAIYDASHMSISTSAIKQHAT